MSSVGQMSALMKFMRFEMMIQNTRLEAAKLRFLICQIRGGVSITRVNRARVGTATAPGVTGNDNPDIVRDVCE